MFDVVMMNKDYPSYLPNGQPETGMYVVAKKKATQEEIDAHQAMKAKRSEDSVPIEQFLQRPASSEKAQEQQQQQPTQDTQETQKNVVQEKLI